MRAFNADVCLEISDGAWFFGSIKRQLVKRGAGQGFVGACEYGKREFSYDESPTRCPPFLLKPSRYAHQREFRMAWETKLEQVAPVIVEVPEATVLMRPVSVE